MQTTETNTELQALQNATSNLSGLSVKEKYFEDKRKTNKMYFLHNISTGETLSPVLDYGNLNHFILGYSKAMKAINKPLIDALQGLLSSYAADFKNITGAPLNDTEAVKKAKEVLNNIK